jgi:DNA repair protein RecN (Recombination protein N)
MLTRLAIQGISILSDVSLEFGPGLNVLTGEPGSGKSLLLAALGLLCGQKASPGLVREGVAEARVEAWFRLAGEERRYERSLARQGPKRTRALVDGRALPLAALGEEVRARLTVTAQHAHLALADPALFMRALDENHAELGAQYQRLYAELATARSELSESLELARRAERELESLRHDLTQLDSLDGTCAEPELVRERLAALRASEQVSHSCARLQNALVERDASVERELRGLIADFERIGHLSRAEPVREALLTALSAVGDAARAADRLQNEVVEEPGELLQLEEQERLLGRLSRRYGCEPGRLRERTLQLRADVERLTAAAEVARVAASNVEALGEQALVLARRLHAARKKRSSELEQRLERELGALGLGSARILLDLTERAAERLDARGLSSLSVLFAANVGERPGELGRIASGGERSRVLVALRCAGVEAAAPTLVLDEIDAGLGGAALEAMAQRLALASRGKQILCVTHHASVAAMADAHFQVRKFVDGGRTQVEVQPLTGEDRVLELSRMLAGGRASGAKPLARRLLEQAKLAQPAA